MAAGTLPTRYIALNSQYYRDDSHTAELRSAQDAWAARAFEEARARGAKHVVVLSHVPPFIQQEREQHGWANWEPKARESLLAAASAAGVKLWLCGHYHGNCVGASRSRLT